MGVWRNGQEHWGATTLQVIQLFHCKLITMSNKYGVWGFPEAADLSCCCRGSFHGTGRGVSTQAQPRRGCCWLDCECHTLLSCDSICSAFRARKGHDAVLAHSEQPSGEWGDGQVKCVRQRRGAKLSVNSREKRNLYEKGERRRRDVLNGKRAERGVNKMLRGERACDSDRRYFLIYKRIQMEIKG